MEVSQIYNHPWSVGSDDGEDNKALKDIVKEMQDNPFKIYRISHEVAKDILFPNFESKFKLIDLATGKEIPVLDGGKLQLKVDVGDNDD